MRLTALLAIGVAGCAGPGCSGREPVTTDTGQSAGSNVVETLPRLGFDAGSVDGWLVHTRTHRAGQPERAPLAYVILDSKGARVAAWGRLKNRCAVAGEFPDFRGDVDAGEALSLDVGSDAMRLTRRSRYFDDEEFAYVNDERVPGFGESPGAPLSLAGESLNVSIPRNLRLAEPIATHAESLHAHRRLSLRWTPEAEPLDGEAVFVVVSGYNDNVGLATENEVVVCLLHDDGGAEIDLSDVFPAEWPFYYIELGRHSYGDVAHPDFGLLRVRAIRSTNLDSYMSHEGP